MLFRFLADRGPSGSKPHQFRWRGDGVSRIEGLSDAVFGFSITLLVVSLEVPKSAQELIHNASGFIPFVASFFILFGFWRTQFEFFRRYGLEDETTMWLTGLLLVMILFLVYPLKFLFTIFGQAALTGFHIPREQFRIDQFPAVMSLYAGGIFGIAVVFALLYRHAFHERERLELTEVEVFDTLATERRWASAAAVMLTILLWCAAMMASPEHLQARDDVFHRVFWGGFAVVMTVVLAQRLVRANLRRGRTRLIARLGTEPERPAATLD